MSLQVFLDKVVRQEPIAFPETQAVISEHYHYTPTEFVNGLNEDRLVNPAGVNEGSCKIFAFAKLHHLNREQTLNLFGDYYRVDVLTDPAGQGHGNIRNFIRYGWAGIEFTGQALRPKTQYS